jgi:hypothetical protein
LLLQLLAPAATPGPCILLLVVLLLLPALLVTLHTCKQTLRPVASSTSGGCRL